MLNPSDFLGGDRKRPAVRQIFGVSGSGKTTLLETWGRQAVKSKEFPKNWRLIVIDVKAEDYGSIAEPIYDLEAAMKSINENRATVYYPGVHDAEDNVETLIDYLFHLSDQQKDFQATMILEESSTYITAHTVPPMIKRMAVQGRSKGLALILANQRMMNNKWLDTQTAHLLAFQCPIPDRKMIKDRWGLNGDQISERLAQLPFSFAHFDFNTLQLRYYAPVDPIDADPIPQDQLKQDPGEGGVKASMMDLFNRSSWR
mgnify:CR=1 FL=1